MKHFILIITILALTCNGFAQTETTVWNGKTYYVYPHQLELQNNLYIFMQYAEFKEVLKRDEKNQKVIRTEIKKLDEEDRANMYGMSRKLTKEQKQQEKLIRELLTKKPDLFYQYGSNMSQDVTPSLTAIPDGEYIQYYRDLPYLDNNILRFKNDVVAGIFTVKNNQLDGLGTWYTANRMVIKSGNFAQSSRQGSWFFNSYTPKRNQFELDLKPEKAMEYLLSNQMKYDTTVERFDYQLGLRNGSYIQKFNDFVLTTGSYKDDKESGTWDFFDFSFVPEADGTYRITDTLVNTKHLTYADKPVRGKGPILRDEIVAQEFMYADYNYYGDEEEESDIDTSLALYNIHSSNGYFESFSSFYTILESKNAGEEGLELPEEGINSYEGEEYEGMPYPGYDDYYPEYMGDNYPTEGFYDYNQTGSEIINGKFYTRNQLIDSVGYQFLYEGLYEEHYGNGQLKFRFEVKDGNLVSEDTVFWENGQAANTIAFDETSRQYTQHFFDYKGKLYKTVLFDEKGEEIRDAQAEDDGAIMIDGLPYYNEDEFQNVAYYSAREFLQDTLLTERTLIQAGRWLRDSSLCMTGYLDPESRVLEFTDYNVMGMPYVTQTATFGEEYANVSALTNTTVGKLRLETIASGSLYDFSLYPYMYNPKNDSVLPQSNALYWQGNYETTTDEVLYVNNQPFTGAFSLQTDASKYRLSVDEKAISIKLPETATMQKKMRKALKKFYKKGKRNELLELYNSDVQYGGTDGTFYSLFPSLSYIFSLTNYNPYGEYGYEEYMYDDYGYEEQRSKKNRVEYPFDKTLTGNYLNGKPEGEWIVKDQFGNITARVNYSKGEREGESVFYATEFPLSETQRNYQQEYLAEYHTYIFETLPEKKTQYLSRREYYSNGLLDGPVVSFNWKGDTLSYDLYRDGRQNGASYQRNKIFYAETSYEEGMIDGISRTYLTLPGRDSILIFDLNFQNGSLQGESKSYHTNGNLAKRGFFLSGQPIDDYEAFDTLGFKYQYVKFQYNQPIEEKIWEENQLSVRYLFDWKDSIPFEISDIAGSTSFERLATDLGLIQNPYSEPYYGRPSLVDKTGINYSITKYYPNDSIARFGNIAKGKKVGYWKHFSYEGKALYEVTYFDTILSINDSIRFKSKGILTYLNEKGQPTSKSYIIEKVEKYDCSHADHNEERMLYAFWEADTSQHRMNGYVKNYYDNGAIQNEGNVVNGLPTGIWKMYDSDGQLNQVGSYEQGKRNGRWLSGDLSNMKNMSEICLNPNLENLEEIMSYQEKLLDVSVIYYGIGKILKREYYGINLNNEEAPEDYYREGDYYRE
jgi:antitoxin component YwqK of YwqJK toxin-antitoxin module